MIGIKGMIMPDNCWQCGLTHENGQGYTVCSVTGKKLYAMGLKNTRPDDCPLIEVKETKPFLLGEVTETFMKEIANTKLKPYSDERRQKTIKNIDEILQKHLK